MFLDNLSARVLRIIDENDYSYETAAELCDMSTRHFGNIVRRHTVPSVNMLENICRGLDISPNRLLLPEQMLKYETLNDTKAEMVRVVLCVDGMTFYTACRGCDCTLAGGCHEQCLDCRHKPELLSGTSILITPRERK